MCVTLSWWTVRRPFLNAVDLPFLAPHRQISECRPGKNDAKRNAMPPSARRRRRELRELREQREQRELPLLWLT